MMIPKPTRFTKIVRKMMSSGRVTMGVVILSISVGEFASWRIGESFTYSPIHQCSEMGRQRIVQPLAVLEPRQDNVGGDRCAAENLLVQCVGDGVHHRPVAGADRRFADA